MTTNATATNHIESEEISVNTNGKTLKYYVGFAMLVLGAGICAMWVYGTFLM